MKILAGIVTSFFTPTTFAEQVPYMARRLTGNEQTPQISGNDADLLAVLTGN